MTRRLLVLELNELCPPLIERFMAEGALPSFARLHREAQVFVTAAEEVEPHLNPWVQWVTAHTGVSYADHGILKLGQGGALRHETVADAVTAAGGSVWLCSPMNVVPVAPVRGTWLPDPWNPDETSMPADLAPIGSFIRSQVQEHTNVARRLSPADHARFLAGMARHGLSLRTIRAVAAQLAGERTGRRHRWRRAALLDHFQWDLFEHVYRRDRPTFATYFSNTTAHYQHLFWRYMQPDAFEVKPTDEELSTYGPAVRSGYVEMDRLVARALDLVDDDTTLVLCTALSQQPYFRKEKQGGSRFYRPHDLDDFVARLGLDGVVGVTPVMAEQFYIRFADEHASERGEQALRDALIGASPAFKMRRTSPTDVMVGVAETADLPPGAEIVIPATGATIDVHRHTYRSETPKSGHHHPDGALWIRTPDRAHSVHAERVSLRSVAPTMLALMGLRPPDSMRSPVLVPVAA